MTYDQHQHARSPHEYGQHSYETHQARNHRQASTLRGYDDVVDCESQADLYAMMRGQRSKPPNTHHTQDHALSGPDDIYDDPLHRPSSFGWRPAEASPATAGSSILQHAVNEQVAQCDQHTNTARPPTIGDISLVSVHALPDRLRSVFTFPLFNAVQSKCFESIYHSSDNFVLSAPTGSGKTAIFELAVCKLVNTCSEGTFKVVYQAPTKSLCAERQRDWQQKFSALNLQVAELTGDIQNAQLKNVQHATIIVTTPEKWDSITRKWKDHKKLMHMVKLFLIDEVHTLQDDRGAVLEVVVSRMKSVGSNVRFVALSATMPNIQDVSAWLGRNPDQQHLPALQETFGEEFRPVRIRKHVRGYQSRGNDFVFDKSLSERLPEVINKFSKGKPILIFCFTRAACAETAKYLTGWLSSIPRQAQPMLACENKDLQATVLAGIAFHHAGLSAGDRSTVENGYLSGKINVICCTSTLAAGVNLPCHMVIIKNAVTYTGTGCKEYSDLEVMQMLGRAGRPQFGDSAIAVIMTRQQQVLHYETLVSGQETIESRLHLNLIDHLNAEIGLGTIHDRASAKAWLCSTFLYIRLQQNPHHYKLGSNRHLQDHLITICDNGIDLLQQHNLITNGELHATAYGDAMSRYCVQFETMQTLLSLKRGARTSEILTAIAQAAEFKEVYFRSGEKAIYRQWNSNPLVKFPLKIHIDASWHKVFLIIQVVLAGSELPDSHREQRQDFNLTKGTVFQHALRLTRCLCDCVIHSQDAKAARHGLALARSLSAQIWDDSTLHMSQLEGLGMAGVRKLVTGGIKTVEELATAESHRLEQILSRNPPFGSQLREKANDFPRLTISIQAIGRPDIRPGDCVVVRLLTSLGFSNSSQPTSYRRKAIQICLLMDAPADQLLHFSRFSAVQMLRQPAMNVEIRLTKHTDVIRAQVMCDDYAGTARSAMLKLQIAESTFRDARILEKSHGVSQDPQKLSSKVISSTSRLDEFDDHTLDDHDLMQVEENDFVDIDDFDREMAPQRQHIDAIDDDTATFEEPLRLENGRWSCRHSCKDKSTCKHLCCREGLDKKPKTAKRKASRVDKIAEKPSLQQSQLKIARKRSAGGTDQSSLTQIKPRTACATGRDQFVHTSDDHARLFEPGDDELTMKPARASISNALGREGQMSVRVTQPTLKSRLESSTSPDNSAHEYQLLCMDDETTESDMVHDRTASAYREPLPAHSTGFVDVIAPSWDRSGQLPTVSQQLKTGGQARPSAVDQTFTAAREIHEEGAPASKQLDEEISTPEAFDIVRKYLGEEYFNYLE